MFYSNLDVRQIGIWENRTVWKYLGPLFFSVWNGIIKSRVPTDSYTDFASVPRHFHMYDYFGGKCNKEAGAHDFLYRKGSIIQINKEIFKALPSEELIPKDVHDWIKSEPNGLCDDIPRFVSDHIFKQLMIEEGRPEILFDPMFNAVRFAGEGSFHKFAVMDVLPCDSFDVVIPTGEI